MIQPKNGQIIVIPDSRKEETISEGGIHLPTETKETPQTGEVYAVAPDVTDVKKGQKVWYKMWSGQEMRWEKQTLRSVHAKDILAIIS